MDLIVNTIVQVYFSVQQHNSCMIVVFFFNLPPSAGSLVGLGSFSLTMKKRKYYYFLVKTVDVFSFKI